uniref:F-box domain-containing protein n=1 Tax=Steinernema glaseri TaxID=37863 RepID=A0A1I7YU88_9BILA
MDHLFFDLVDEIVNFLPRSDVETIARVARRSSRLEFWSAAAEDHLENRFLLDVRVYVEKALIKKELPKVFLSAKKTLPNGLEEDWNFTRWRYAWIRDVSVETERGQEFFDFKESHLDQVVRCVSLPVEPGPRGSLHVFHNHTKRPRKVIAVTWAILLNTQRGFAVVDLEHSKRDPPEFFENYVMMSISRGRYLRELRTRRYLRELRTSGIVTQIKLASTLTPLFGIRYETPLSLEVPIFPPLEQGEVEEMIETWLKSDGRLNDISIFCVNYYWEGDSPPKHEFLMERPNLGYLVHPTKRTTLTISDRMISVEQFRPWHLRVDFAWIDSVITRWRQGDGTRLGWGEWHFFVAFQSEEDWLQLEEKYGPCEHKFSRRLSIAHPRNTVRLEVTKKDHMFEVSVRAIVFTHLEMEMVTNDWKTGSGDVLPNGSTQMEVRFVGSKSSIHSYMHPNNGRCLTVQSCDSGLAIFSISPLDPEEIEDWNLALLFEQP